MNIRTKRGQEAIQPSTVIHWDKVSKGLSVGLYKNDSLRWYARCFHQGKYHKKNLPFATDFKTAVVEANRFEAHLKDGKHQSRQQKSETKRTGQMTVRELVDEYLRVPVIDKANPMNSVRGSDRAAQKASRGEHADWKREQNRRYKADWSHLDDVLVVDVTKDMLADHRKLLQRKVTKSGKLVSPDTINRQMVPLNSALAYAVEEGYIPRAPKLKTLPKRLKHEQVNAPSYFPKEVRAKILENCSPELRDILTACEYTGCRPVEARRLLVKHVNLIGNPSVYFYSFKGVNGGKERHFPLAGKRLEFFKRMAKGRKQDEPLFLTPKERKAWDRDNLSKALRHVTRPMNLDADFVGYCFRHAFITEAVSHGGNPMELAQMCGTSLKHIEENYSHLRPSATSSMPPL